MSNLDLALAAVTQERHHQRERFNDTKQTVQEWELIIRQCLEKSEKSGDMLTCMNEMRQIAACAVACMQQHVVTFRQEVRQKELFS